MVSLQNSILVQVKSYRTTLMGPRFSSLAIPPCMKANMTAWKFCIILIQIPNQTPLQYRVILYTLWYVIRLPAIIFKKLYSNNNNLRIKFLKNMPSFYICSIFTHLQSMKISFTLIHHKHMRSSLQLRLLSLHSCFSFMI